MTGFVPRSFQLLTYVRFSSEQVIQHHLSIHTRLIFSKMLLLDQILEMETSKINLCGIYTMNIFNY